MCGDSTSADDMARLMNGKHAQMVVTSPIYGVGKEYEQKGIEPWIAIVKPIVKNITKHADVICWNLGDLYSTGTQFIEPTNVYSVNFFADCGFRPIWIRIWKKQGINYGIGAYHLVTNKPAQQYEYITAFGNNTEPEYNDQEYAWVSAFAGHSYKFVKRLTKDERKKWGYAGIWEINTVKANNDHPAKFPIELPARCIKMHSDKDGVVLEPFSGSFSTGIACEQLGRICYGMEITPEYVELSCRRYLEFTGNANGVAVERNGENIPWGDWTNAVKRDT
jgi:DNA modification methylase